MVADAQKLATIRAWLTGYAASVPGHGMSDFGDRVSVTAVCEGEAYQLHLANVYERRSLEGREKAYDGTGPRTPSVGGHLDVWGQGFPLPGSISDGTVEDRTIPGTEETVPCGGCGVTGRVRCDGCGGQGKVGCDGCKATGKVTCGEGFWAALQGKGCQGKGSISCGSCGGTGKVKCGVCSGAGGSTTTEWAGQRWVECWVCLGKGGGPSITGGYSECSACKGKKLLPEDVQRGVRATCHKCQGEGTRPCTECNSAGKLTCSKCGGKGTVKCGKCEGTKVVNCGTCSGATTIACGTCKGEKYLGVRYRVISRAFRANEANQRLAVGVGPEVAGAVDHGDLLGVVDIARERLDASLPLENVAQVAAGWARGEIGRGLAASSAEARLVQQRLAISKTPVTQVEYAYGGKGYRIFFVGRQNRPVASVSPISEWVEKERQRLTQAREERDREKRVLDQQVLDTNDSIAGVEKEIKEQKAKLVAPFKHWFKKWFRIDYGAALGVALVLSLLGCCGGGLMAESHRFKWGQVVKFDAGGSITVKIKDRDKSKPGKDHDEFKEMTFKVTDKTTVTEVEGDRKTEVKPEALPGVLKEGAFVGVEAEDKSDRAMAIRVARDGRIPVTSRDRVAIAVFLLGMIGPWLAVGLVYVAFRLTVDQARYKEELDRTVNSEVVAVLANLDTRLASLNGVLAQGRGRVNELAEEIQRLDQQAVVREQQINSLSGRQDAAAGVARRLSHVPAPVVEEVTDPDLADLIRMEREEEKARRPATCPNCGQPLVSGWPTGCFQCGWRAG